MTGRRIGEGEWKLETIFKELAQEIEAREQTFACTTDPIVDFAN